jgi:Holliday junction resolvasome RuvABC DNA-binding subunit
MASSLRERIDTCVQKRAALEERKKRAEQDLNTAKEALKALGLAPKTAWTAIRDAEAELTAELEEVEKTLGIA